MNKFLLEAIKIKKTYKHINGNITIFNNLNLKIKHGDLIALVGPSGSGKSSLLHLFALLDEPSKGKILINNKETNSLTESQKDKLSCVYGPQDVKKKKKFNNKIKAQLGGHVDITTVLKEASCLKE